MLLAALGERFIERHPWASERWYQERWSPMLEKFRERGIAIGVYDPANTDESSA